MIYVLEIFLYLSNCKKFVLEESIQFNLAKYHWHRLYLLWCVFHTDWFYIRSDMGCLGDVFVNMHTDSLVQDCSISFANALEILQSCPKLLIGQSQSDWYSVRSPVYRMITEDCCVSLRREYRFILWEERSVGCDPPNNATEHTFRSPWYPSKWKQSRDIISIWRYRFDIESI